MHILKRSQMYTLKEFYYPMIILHQPMFQTYHTNRVCAHTEILNHNHCCVVNVARSHKALYLSTNCE